MDTFRRSALIYSMMHVDQVEDTVDANDPEEILGKFEVWIRTQARQVLGETVGQHLLEAMGLEQRDAGRLGFSAPCNSWLKLSSASTVSGPSEMSQSTSVNPTLGDVVHSDHEDDKFCRV